jgi:hypothetical protein
VGSRTVALCRDHQSLPVVEGFVQVYTTTREFEAQLLRDNLRAEGISAQVFSQRDSILSFDLGELSIIRLMVPVPEYRRAAELLRSHMDEAGEVVFACPGCGEAYDPGQTECTACGGGLG